MNVVCGECNDQVDVHHDHVDALCKGSSLYSILGTCGSTYLVYDDDGAMDLDKI